MLRQAIAALLLIAAPAMAQELPEVPLPPGVAALMATTVAEGDQLQGVTAYAVDADLDGDPDLIAEVASSPIGGNAVWIQSYILRNAGGTYEIAAPLDINGFINSLRLDGTVVTITSTTYLDGDPRCCPTGTEVKAFVLR
jgi:hypothetical protein